METPVGSDSWPVDGEPEAVLARSSPPVSGGTLLQGSRLKQTDTQPCVLIDNSRAVDGASNWSGDVQVVEAPGRCENHSDERIPMRDSRSSDCLDVAVGQSLTASRKLTSTSSSQDPFNKVTGVHDIPNDRLSSVSESSSLSSAAQSVHESGFDASVGQKEMKQVDEFDMGYGTGVPLPELLPSISTEFHSTRFSGLSRNLGIAAPPEIVVENEAKPDDDEAINKAMEVDVALAVHDASLNADPCGIMSNESSHDMCINDGSHTWSSVPQKDEVVRTIGDCGNDVNIIHIEKLEASSLDELPETVCHKTDGLVGQYNRINAEETKLSTEESYQKQSNLQESDISVGRQPQNMAIDSGIGVNEVLGTSGCSTCTEPDIMSFPDDNIGFLPVQKDNQTIEPEKSEFRPDEEIECKESDICAVEQPISMMVEKASVTEHSKHYDINAVVQDEKSACDTIDMTCSSDCDTQRIDSEKIVVFSGIEVRQKNPATIQRISSENSAVEMGLKEHITATLERPSNIIANGGRNISEASKRSDRDADMQPEEFSCTNVNASDISTDQTIRPGKTVICLGGAMEESIISIGEQLPGTVDTGPKNSDSLNKYDDGTSSQPRKQVSVGMNPMTSAVEFPLNMVADDAQRIEPEACMSCPSIEDMHKDSASSTIVQPVRVLADGGFKISDSLDKHAVRLTDQLEEHKCDTVAVVDHGVPEQVEPVIFIESDIGASALQQQHYAMGHDTVDISESLNKNNNGDSQHEELPGTATVPQTSGSGKIDQPSTMTIGSELDISDSLNMLGYSTSVPDIGLTQRMEPRKVYPSAELELKDSTVDTVEEPLNIEVGDGIKVSEFQNNHPRIVGTHADGLSRSENEEIHDGENGVDHYELVRHGDESGHDVGDDITHAGLSDETRFNREQELNEMANSDDNRDAELLQETELDNQLGLDANIKMRSPHSYAGEEEKEVSEFVLKASNLQDDFGHSIEIADTEQNQHRKRARRPGKKVLDNEEKQANDSDALEHQQPRKRGRKLGGKTSRKEEEDVCFVCYDGGNLILCDKRSCPKAYHIECTGRESEFFQKRGQWFCGWHVCSQCSRTATIHCFTCPRALCNACLKEANFQRITKNRGLCEGCFTMVHMIEHNETINAEGVEVDFNDHETYEGLFNDYWQDIKLKHSITSANFEKLGQSKDDDQELADVMTEDPEEAADDEACGSTDSEDKPPSMRQLRLIKRKRQTRSSTAENVSTSDVEGDDEDGDELERTPKKSQLKFPEFDGWASKELLEMIKHMKEDPKKQLSLSGVKKLLWRYIDESNLTNPRRRGQIICDERLQKLFGKKNVGRIEMIKLISLHIASPAKYAASKATELRSGENDAADFNGGDESWHGRKKSRRKGDEKYLKVDPSEYAAVNVKNINLIYLKRSVLDELRNDPDLENKIAGAFVRIRVPSMVNKNDTCYRLVQVVGTKQIYDAIDPEKVTDVILEILNLDKREEVTADLVSNQDFLEEECQRLRQSVRCGFIKAMTVGELEERAKALREAKVKDWFEAELLRLSHLRDRASEKGRKRELRECVEKLQLLSSPEEKERRLNAPFDIDVDPRMDPSFESDDEDLPLDENSGDIWTGQNMHEKNSATETVDRMTIIGGTTKFQNHWDNGIVESQESQRKAYGWIHKGTGWAEKDSGRKDTKQYMGIMSLGQSSANEKKVNWGDGSFGRDKAINWNVQGGTVGRKEVRWMNNVSGVSERSGWGDDATNAHITNTGIYASNNQIESKSSLSMSSPSIISPVYLPGATSHAGTNNITVDNEKEKIWCYQDPTKTIQGPFSMEQLRKWEKTNLFPLDLQIWRVTESQDASILLTDALAGRFSKRAIQEPHGIGQGSSIINFAATPTHNLNIYSGALTQSGTTGITQGSTALNAANGLSVSASGHSSSSLPGSSLHGFPTTQLSTVQGYPSGTIQAPQIHGFSPGTGQASNIQSFQPGATQVPYGNYSQVPHVKSLSAGALQSPTQGLGTKTFTNVPMQGPSVTSFPHTLSSMGNHSQGSHYSGPLNRPHSTNFPMNIPQRTNVSRDFRTSGLSSVGNKSEDGVWGRGTNFRGPSSQGDIRDGSTQRNSVYGQKFRESQGIEGRFTPKKDLLCRFFARGICRKGPDCDFKHE